jgi:hypothetical protein
MVAKLAVVTEFGGGDGEGPFDPRDITIMIQEQQIQEFRDVMRRLLDSEGEEAGEAIEAAEKLLGALDTIDAEDEAEREMLAFQDAPFCPDCRSFKGKGEEACPVCDPEYVANRDASRREWEAMTPEQQREHWAKWEAEHGNAPF